MLKRLISRLACRLVGHDWQYTWLWQYHGFPVPPRTSWRYCSRCDAEELA